MIGSDGTFDPGPRREVESLPYNLLVEEVDRGNPAAVDELARRRGTLTAPQEAAREWIEELRRYSKRQPRDKNGRFAGGGGGGGGKGGGGVSPGADITLRDGTKVKAVKRSALSNPDTPRTRGVSREEFTALANEGHARLAEFRRNGGSPEGLDRNMRQVKDHAFEQVQSEWGGGTYDAHTGKPLAGNEDRYALTVKPPGVDSVSVPIGAGKAEFDGAVDTARQRFDSQLRGQQHHLGVFRDEDSGRIDIDPVLVVNNHHDVETIGAATHAVGGAYNFADGNGYWPPYVSGA